jgi:fluoride exporter
VITAVCVAAGAAVGAPLRYLVDRAVQARHDTGFPWGTFTVNVVGCLILGLLATGSFRVPGPVFAAAGTGLCGALTTYSTFGYETVRLLQDRARLHAAAYVAASLLGGLGAAIVGATLAAAFSG